MKSMMRGLGARVGVVLGLVALLPAQSVAAQTNTLHGTAAEAQAVREMRERLQAALANGNVAACQREGENLARYNQAAAGKALVDADLAAVQHRLGEISRVYDYFRQIRDLSDKQAVEQAYGLIRDVQDKLTNDALTEVTVTLVTAPLPGLGQIIVEMGKGAEDFLGSYADARGLVDRARVLRSLEKMARYADEQLGSLQPATREAEAARSLLIACAEQYQAGVAAVLGVGAAAPPSASPAGGTFTAEKGTSEAWSHIRVTVGNVTGFKTADRPGWRNNGTGFTADAAGDGRVTIRIDITGKGGVSYFDYATNVAVLTADGKPLLAEKPMISKDGGNTSFSTEWVPADGGRVSIEVKITGGNPEYFTYFVTGTIGSGRVQSRPVTPKPQPTVSRTDSLVPQSAATHVSPSSQTAGDENLAVGRAAQQSSTSFGGDALRAVDGNRDGNHAGNSVSHTAEQAQPWWQADLGAVRRIGDVRIWNRTDCCGERLSKFYVFVSDAPFASADVNATLAQPGVWHYYQGGAAGRTTDVSVRRSGRYVRVQLAGTNFLSLAEVEIFGAAGDPP